MCITVLTDTFNVDLQCVKIYQETGNPDYLSKYYVKVSSIEYFANFEIILLKIIIFEATF